MSRFHGLSAGKTGQPPMLGPPLAAGSEAGGRVVVVGWPSRPGGGAAAVTRGVAFAAVVVDGANDVAVDVDVVEPSSTAEIDVVVGVAATAAPCRRPPPEQAVTATAVRSTRALEARTDSFIPVILGRFRQMYTRPRHIGWFCTFRAGGGRRSRSSIELFGILTSVSNVRTLARLARILERSSCDLSMPQYRLLAMVAEGDERASALAGRLTLSKPTITAAVDGLVERGLVTRGEVAGDRRAVRITITAAGRRALKAAELAMQDRLDGILDSCADRRGVEQALEQLGQALDGMLAERLQDGAHQ